MPSLDRLPYYMVLDPLDDPRALIDGASSLLDGARYMVLDHYRWRNITILELCEMVLRMIQSQRKC
jgi:hypothetical protein